MKIAIDAMGGDNAPAAVVEGSIKAVLSHGIDVVLVGQENLIKKELEKYSYPKGRVSIHHTDESISMDEVPVAAVKQKKKASINICVNLLKNAEVDAIVSAGNTGAYMTSAFLGLGRIKGIERPAIATFFPTIESKTMLLDMGANVDCKPKQLAQFAKMGYVFRKFVDEMDNPRVALLNIGEEEAKGNELTTTTFKMLKESNDINFIGNIEAKDVLSGQADVIVCDGFVGNMILKFGEGVGMHLIRMVKNEIKHSLLAMIGALFMYWSLKRMRKIVDYDEYGGALILGLKGICVKAHGRANAKAFHNAIKRAIDSHSHGILEKIQTVH